jgi:hypothetical protein
VTNLPGTPPETIRRMLSEDVAITAVRQGAFRALLDGRAPTASELAATSGLGADQIERAIEELRNQGALEVGPGGRVIGAHGLTNRTTRHAISTPERTWHTWCALDAIGIPVALGLDADVRTSCPTCRAVINVVVRHGSPSGEGRPMLWLPTGPCSHVMDDFCATASLFCNADHLEQWRVQEDDPQGLPLTLDDVADQGRRLWSDVRH